MKVKKLRLQRGWSQDHLSQVSGLSIRTIQRIEKGQKAGLESLKSLAAVFDIHITELQKEPQVSEQVKEPKQVNKVKRFHASLITYFLVISMLFIINFITDPSYLWAFWPAMGWGIGIILRGLKVFKGDLKTE